MPCDAAVLIPSVGCGHIGAYALPEIWPASLAVALRLRLHPLDAERLGDEHDWVGVSAAEEGPPRHDHRVTRYVADGGVRVADLGLPEVCTVEHTPAVRRELGLGRLRLPARGMDCNFDFVSD